MSVVPRIVEIAGIDPETAWLDAQRDARHAYGHSGRTGTIADADGHILVSGPALLPWDGRRAAQQILRDGHAKPGGPVFVLRLADPARTRKVTVSVDITGMTDGQIDDAVDAAVREKLPDEEWGIVSVDVRRVDAEGEGRKGTRKAKVVLTPGAGKKVSKFSVRHEATGKELVSFPTLVSAKGWMKDALAKGSAPMVCVQESVRESGPLLSGREQVVKETVAVVAVVGRPAPGGNGKYFVSGLFPSAG